MTTKRITIATVKSFIRKNRQSLLICYCSHFDGMTDSTQHNDNPQFVPAGAWFVGRSRDFLSAFDDGERVGFSVSNACGSFILAIAKE
jgi:hypothetical protein